MKKFFKIFFITVAVILIFTSSLENFIDTNIKDYRNEKYESRIKELEEDNQKYLNDIVYLTNKVISYEKELNEQE